RIRLRAQLVRPRIDLRRAEDTLLDEITLDGREPALVIAGGKILGRRHALDPVAELVDIVEALHRADTVDTADASFPGFVEDWLVLLALDPAEAVRATARVPYVRATPPADSSTCR